jgi:hypothetical protein
MQQHPQLHQPLPQHPQPKKPSKFIRGIKPAIAAKHGGFFYDIHLWESLIIRHSRESGNPAFLLNGLCPSFAREFIFQTGFPLSRE